MKVSNCLYKLFNYLLLIFPFGISIIFATYNILYMCGFVGEIGYVPNIVYKNEHIIISIIIMFVYLLLIYSIYALLIKVNSDNTKLTLAFIFIISFLLRFVLIITLKPELFSDFQLAWNRANGDVASLNYYRYFPAYVNYSFFLSIFIDIFGPNEIFALIANAIINSLSIIIIFCICKYFNHKLAIISSLIIALNPSAIIYNLVLTPEHITILCNLVAVLLIITLLKTKHSTFAKVLLIIISGIILGIGGSIKTFYPIMIIAAIIVITFSLLNKIISWKKLIKLMLALLLLSFTASSTCRTITKVSEEKFNVILNFKDATPHFLCVGLNREGYGQINIGNISRQYITNRTNGMSYNEAKKVAIETIYNDWKANINDLPLFLVRKLSFAWQDDLTPLKYVFEYENVDFSNHIQEKLFTKYANFICEAYYLLEMIIAFFAICKILKRKINYYIFINNLLIFGYFCMILLSEAQSRYKCLIIPFIVILDGYYFINDKQSVNTKKN